MNTSDNGLKFIAAREACVTVAYLDGKHADGSPKYSIGFGSQTGNPQPGDMITVENAFKRLRTDLDLRDLVISHSLSVSVSQWMWDSVASLYFEVGSAALRDVAGLLNAGQTEEAKVRFAAYGHGEDGVLKDGIISRRAREMLVATVGDYGDLSTFKLYTDNPRATAPKATPFPT